MKKVKFLLQHIDGIWSVPLGFFLFFFVGLTLTSIFGYGAGTYDVGFIQPLFLAATIVIGATNAGVIGLWFTLRGLHQFLYGSRQKDPAPGERKYVNFSEIKWLKLTPLQQFTISLLSLAYFITAIIVVYLKLV